MWRPYDHAFHHDLSCSIPDRNRNALLVHIQAYREGKLPFPDGTVIAALHYRNVPSDENNKVFGDVQSFVPGAPTNIQFMIRDSKKYAPTGGWGFAHFQDGKAADAAFMEPCFPCHMQA
jgi:hypothetical protein